MSSPLHFRRLHDPAIVNRIINHPALIEDVGEGKTDLDATELIKDSNNIVLGSETGCIIYARMEPGVYDTHANFLPGSRGQQAIDAGKWSIDWMFTHTPAQTLMAWIPPRFEQVMAYAEACGFDPVAMDNGKQVYRLEKSKWVSDQ